MMWKKHGPQVEGNLAEVGSGKTALSRLPPSPLCMCQDGQSNDMNLTATCKSVRDFHVGFGQLSAKWNSRSHTVPGS